MKKAICTGVILVMLMSAFPVFATDNVAQVDNVDSLIQTMNENSDDGIITKTEQNEVTQTFSEEAIEEYNKIVEEEVQEALDNQEEIWLESDENVNIDNTILLDSGAILETEIVSEDVDDVVDEDSSASKVIEFFIPTVYAGTQSYGTKKYSQRVTVYSTGSTTLWTYTWLKCHSGGMTITKASREASSSGMMNVLSSKVVIEDKHAEKVGYDCHVRSGVKHNTSYIPYGHSGAKWRNCRMKFVLKSVNKSTKKVTFTYKAEAWNSNTW